MPNDSGDCSLRELTDGGADYAIDAVGLPRTQEEILRSVKAGYAGLNRGGTALLIGITPPGLQASLDTNLFVERISPGTLFPRWTNAQFREIAAEKDQ
jgi:threonine dehydrogenase-like Zn-dependent dehydrogenase